MILSPIEKTLELNIYIYFSPRALTEFEPEIRLVFLQLYQTFGVKYI